VTDEGLRQVVGTEAKPGGEQAAIARRALIVVTGTLGSRVLGAIRDAVIAATFTLRATDAFFVAFTIPNALRVLLGEGAASGAFVPVYTEVREKEGRQRAELFYARLVGAMVLVLGAVTAAGVVAAPWLVTLYAAGYDAERFELTVVLTRIVFPYIFLMGLAALGMGALHSEGRFAVPSFAPALLNVALIAAALGGTGLMPRAGLPAVAALAFGALVGGVLQVLAQVPILVKLGLFVRPRFGGNDPYVRKTFRLMVPLFAGLGVYQLNVLLSRLFASFLPTGAQSYLYYAQRVVEIPQGVFAFAIAAAALPSLSQMRARGDDAAVRETFGYGLRLNLFVAIPAAVALVILAEPTITVLFGRGNFDATRVSETAPALVMMAAGIWAVASVRTIVPMFHAYNDTRSPVIGSVVNLVVFVGTSLATMATLAHVGLALAITLAGGAQLVTLLVLLRRKVGPLGLRAVAKSTARILVAALPLGVVVFFIARQAHWERGGNDPQNVVVFVVAVATGSASYLLAAKLLRAPELDDTFGALVRKLRSRMSR
jgi:putative peptidoglycan lipid II flippase